MLTLKDFLRLPLILFGSFGMPLFRLHPEHRFTKREKLVIAIFSTQLFINCYFLLSCIYFCHIEASDIIYSVLILCYVNNSFMKGLTMFFKKARIEQVIWRLLSIFPETEAKQLAYRTQENYMQIRKYNKFLIIYHLTGNTLFNLEAIIYSFIEHWYGWAAEFSYRLPYNMFYHMDVRHAHTYAFAIVSQLLGSYSTGFMCLSSDMLLMTLVQLVKMHLEYLGNSIVGYTPTGGVNDMQRISQFIAYHRELLGICKQIDNIFSITNLLSFMTSCVLICLIGLQIVLGVETIVFMFKFFVLMFNTMVHLFFITLFANRLREANFEIATAFMQHPWYMGNARYQRMVLMPITRAQRGASLTGFKFFDITMETFKTLLTTSYQIFAMLRTTLDSNASA